MSPKHVFSSALLVLIWGASFTLPASAQHFQQVKGSLVSVAAGRNEVFGIDAHGLPWRYDAAKLSFEKVTGATSLVQIAVGGGTLSQLDEVWALAAHNKVFRFNYRTDAFDPIPAPAFSQITVGEGAAQNILSSSLNPDKCYPYEVWGAEPNPGPDTSGLFARYNFCENTFDSFFRFSGNMIQGATGGGDVWGLEKTRNPTDANPVHFIDSEGEINFLFSSGSPMSQITVGVNDVWGIDSSNQIFRYDPNTNGFVQLGNSPQLRQIAAGGDGVWGVDPIGQIWRFDSSSASFVQVDGVLKSIAVGYGAGVWGVDSADEVFTFVRP
jgi:hypothetical protein